jgi:hypothetical protein
MQIDSARISMPTRAQERTPSSFSMLNEKALHSGIKAWYARPGDQFEAPVDGFIIDIVRDDLLVEIQTGNFSAIRRKLTRLADLHPVRLVYPIAREKWIVKDGAAIGKPSRRKSPKRGRLEDLFAELVSLPHLLSHSNFSIEILLIQEEEVRRPNHARGWRRKEWVTHERRLLRVLERRLFESPAQLAAMIPETLVQPFTTADLASALAMPRWLAQKMAYCLRVLGATQAVGKLGHAVTYQRALPVVDT